MDRIWQEINGEWHSCHWWQDPVRRRITAMTFLILMSVLAAVMIAHSLRLVAHDGRGPQRPPASHFLDPDFRSPAAGR